MLSRYTLILCALACITFWGTISLSAFASFPLSIIEVQTEGIRANDEFIQLKNTAALSQDLTGFKILHKIYSQTKDTCSEETLVTPSRFSHKSILGNGSFLIAHPDYAVFHPLDPPADLVYPVSNTLTKNTMEIVLLDAQGRILDTHVLGTLCEIQDVPEESPSSLPMTGAIRINEVFPNPDTPQDVGEYIELYNLSDTDIDLSGWKITDATKTGGDYTFPSKTSLPAHGYFVIDDTDFSFSLNNGEEALSLFNPTGTLIDTVTYTKTTEGASLNRTATGWRASRTLTPLAPNILSNTLPSTKERVPKKGYRQVNINFEANGKDTDGDRLKYVWDFGDGHKSYLEETSHRYEKSGTYTVTLTTKDGSEEIVETFRLKIEKFDPPKLRIMRLLPNPAGADTTPGAEWIEIQNHTKKNVDLLGYSIATGSKKLVNHPIRASFIIPKKSVRRLTRAHALFALPNQKGKIELRAPDGKPIHDLKYGFDSSLTDNTILQKEKGKPIKTIAPPDNPPVSPPQSPTVEQVPAPTTESPVSTSPEPTTHTPTPALTAPPSVDTNNTRFLELTTLGTSLVISGENQTAHPTPEIRMDEWLAPDPHYALVFLTHLSTQANTKINTLFTSDPQGE